MKTIGILGGIGPQATMDFVARLHCISQSLIPQKGNMGYPPLVVYYLRQPPIVLDEDFNPKQPLEPSPALMTAVKQVGPLADFLVIPSNTPHAFQDRIEEAAGCPLISILEVTLREVQRRGWERVGVLTMGEPIFYTQPLGDLGLAYETVDREMSERLDREILKVMEGKEDHDSITAARQAVDELRGRGVDGVILGCTEIPLLIEGADRAEDLSNPAQLLAEEAVQRAMD